MEELKKQGNCTLLLLENKKGATKWGGCGGAEKERQLYFAVVDVATKEENKKDATKKGGCGEVKRQGKSFVHCRPLSGQLGSWTTTGCSPTSFLVSSLLELLAMLFETGLPLFAAIIATAGEIKHATI